MHIEGTHHPIIFAHKSIFSVARILLTFPPVPCYNFFEACRQTLWAERIMYPKAPKTKRRKATTMKRKITKRKLILLSASTIGSILLLIAALAALSSRSTLPPQETNTESETLRLPSHLEQSESGDNENQSTSDGSSDEGSLTQGTEGNIADSDQANEESNKETLESATPDIPEPSLEFISNGNGTCVLTGIGTVLDSYVVIPLLSPEGDVVTSISEKAFYGNDFIRAIEIPSTVSRIGDMAFSACSQLVYISVDKDNKSFVDLGGILFTSDMLRLIAYPSASGASAISLPISVTEIAPMAFFNCNNLKTIDYDGSAEQWSNISIGGMNYGLYSASIICKSSEK